MDEVDLKKNSYEFEKRSPDPIFVGLFFGWPPKTAAENLGLSTLAPQFGCLENSPIRLFGYGSGRRVWRCCCHLIPGEVAAFVNLSGSSKLAELKHIQIIPNHFLVDDQRGVSLHKNPWPKHLKLSAVGQTGLGNTSL